MDDMDDKNKNSKPDAQPFRLGVSSYTQRALKAMYKYTKTPGYSALPEQPYYIAEDFNLKTANINKLITYIHMNIIKLHARMDIIEKHLGIPPGRFEAKE